MCYVKFFASSFVTTHPAGCCSDLQDPEKYGLVNRSFNLVVQFGEHAVAGGNLDVSYCKFVCRSWMAYK